MILGWTAGTQALSGEGYVWTLGLGLAAVDPAEPIDAIAFPFPRHVIVGHAEALLGVEGRTVPVLARRDEPRRLTAAGQARLQVDGDEAIAVEALETSRAVSINERAAQSRPGAMRSRTAAREPRARTRKE